MFAVRHVVCAHAGAAAQPGGAALRADSGAGGAAARTLGAEPARFGGAFALFAASLLLSACVGSALCLLVYFSCFFTVSSEGIRSVLLPVAELLSGGLQVFWLIVMLSGGAALQRRGLRRLCVQGG